VSDARAATGEAVPPGGQLYLIGPPDWDPDGLARGLEAALSTGGVVAFRLRPAHRPLGAVQALQQICAGRVAFLLQDDIDLALSLGADGVHLSDPAGVREARAGLGPDRIVGASCGRSRHAAMLAGEDGADYIAFGEVGRKPQPPLFELIAWWNELFVLPCLLQGVFDEAGLELAARADFIGVSDEVWRHPDGAAAGVRALRQALTRG
jgi:thiamine-phosphate pyrophosphorylase